MNWIKSLRGSQDSGFASLDKFMSEVESELNHVFSDDFYNMGLSKSYSRLPKVNISETDEEFIVEAFVPGVDKTELSVKIVDEKSLQIAVKHAEQQTEQKRKFLFREISERGATRLIPFSAPLEADKINAKLDKGILTVVVPKKKQTAQTGSVASVAIN